MKFLRQSSEAWQNCLSVQLTELFSIFVFQNTQNDLAVDADIGKVIHSHVQNMCTLITNMWLCYEIEVINSVCTCFCYICDNFSLVNVSLVYHLGCCTNDVLASSFL